MPGKQITMNEYAVETAGSMYHHVQKLGTAYGETSKQYVEALASYARVTNTVFQSGFGPQMDVSRDGALSLLCIEGGFVFGIIWHEEKRHCTVEGCQAYLTEDAKAWTYSRDHVMCDAHVPSFPYDAPAPGTWSTHS
jgi:hypothetical protein